MLNMRLLLQFPVDLSALLIVNPFFKMGKNEKRCFHDSKLKLVKALLFRSFHETEAPTAGFCSAFICGRAYFRYHSMRMKLLLNISAGPVGNRNVQ